MKIYERMFEASVRIENAWPFPVSPAPDSLAETLEFYDHALPPEIEALIKGWSDDEREELFSGMSGRFQDAYEELCAKAFRTQVSGWLAIAAVPVFTALDSGGGCSFSWGHYHTKLIFAAAADQLLIAACDWGEEHFRQAESQKPVLRKGAGR